MLQLPIFIYQFPQEKFLSYGRILTLDYYFLLMCILFTAGLKESPENEPAVAVMNLYELKSKEIQESKEMPLSSS